MVKLIHRSPAGALAIVGVPGVFEPGEPFEVPDDEQAERLLIQSDLYAKATKADLKAWEETLAARAAEADAAKAETEGESA
jgi:hypothetical protein